MATINSITGGIDVQSELDKIKSLGRAIGALMIDETGFFREDVGELGFLVFHLAQEVEKN